MRLEDLQEWWNGQLAANLADQAALYEDHTEHIRALRALPLLNKDPKGYVAKASTSVENLPQRVQDADDKGRGETLDHS